MKYTFPPDPTNPFPISVFAYLPPALIEQLDAWAEKEGISRDEVVNHCIGYSLEHLPDVLALMEARREAEEEEDDEEE